MNLPELNKAQKIFLACFGLLILFIQLIKFDDEGIEGSGWVIAIVAACLLMLPAFSQFVKTRSNPVTVKKPILDLDSLLSERCKTQSLFEKIRVKAIELRDSLITWIDLPDTPELAKAKPFIKDYWLQYTLAYIVSIASVVEFKRNNKYFDSSEAKMLWSQTAKHMIDLTIESIKSNNARKEYDVERIKSKVLSELKEAKEMIDFFLSAFLAQSAEPDAVLINYMIKKLGVTGHLNDQFILNLRKFTKLTFVEFSSMDSL